MEIRDYIEDEIYPDIIALGFTGSRYICDPPPMDTDLDIVILVNDRYDIDYTLKKEGWVHNVGEGYDGIHGGNFNSYKKEFNGTLVNYIITENEKFYTKFIEATDAAKKLNLLDKQDRIDLFESIMGKHNVNQQRPPSNLRPLDQVLLLEGQNDLAIFEGWGNGN